MNVKETNKIVVAGGELNAASKWFLSQIVTNSTPQYAKSLAWETIGKEDYSGIKVFIRRPSDVPISINALTSINAGVSNSDSWEERSWTGERLPINVSELGNARICIAMPAETYRLREADFDGLASVLEGCRGYCIATEFPILLSNSLGGAGVPSIAVQEQELPFAINRIRRDRLVGIVRTAGKTEVMPKLYLQEILAIADVVATGKSLRENGLVEVAKILDTRFELGWKGKDEFVSQLIKVVSQLEAE